MSIKKISLITDAWKPQTNGVVTTLSQLTEQCREMGIEFDIIQPNDYRHFPLPTYPEIPWVWSAKGLKQRLIDFQPDAIHIATEGGLGWKGRKACRQLGVPFTSAYHTKYPEYIHQRFPIPTTWLYAFFRRFHQASSKTLVPGQSILEELETKGFENLALMTRGVDKAIFNAERKKDLPYPKPITLYVGRISPEKNIEAFLDCDLPGSKVLVGKGPSLEALQQAYPDAHFVGAQYGEALAEYYASADVFVFPSLTDTFGVVNIEAIACGTPVAAFPVTGPKDIITPGLNGALNWDLTLAIEEALRLDPSLIEASIPQYSWQSATRQFLDNLVLIDWSKRR